MPEQLSHISYEQLRSQALTHIQELAGHRWTDHNVHDPGITILEQLCYVLTDLAYRIGFDIPDLMAEGGRDSEGGVVRKG